MNTKTILWGLILATTAIYAVLYLLSQEYSLAAAAVLLGLIWLVVEMNQPSISSWLFFLGFLAMAILGSLKNIAPLVILLGASTNLAAWDLARFRIRLAAATDPAAQALLEASHLPKLAVTIGLGYLVAVLPILVQLSVNFVILCALLLMLVMVLRAAALRLRDTPRR